MKNLIITFLMVITMPLAAELKIVAFSGSTREGSFNKKLVEQAAQMARQMGATVTVVDLKQYPIPYYDADVEQQGLPENARRFRDLLVASDAVIISTPEYNASVSAVLKNALDWASRKDGSASRSAFKGKKFAIMSTSPGQGGGQRALRHLREIIQDVGGEVVPTQVAISNAYTAFDENGLKEGPGKQQLQVEVSQLFPPKQ